MSKEFLPYEATQIYTYDGEPVGLTFVNSSAEKTSSWYLYHNGDQLRVRVPDNLSYNRSHNLYFYTSYLPAEIGETTEYNYSTHAFKPFITDEVYLRETDYRVGFEVTGDPKVPETYIPAQLVNENGLYHVTFTYISNDNKVYIVHVLQTGELVDGKTPATIKVTRVL